MKNAMANAINSQNSARPNSASGSLDYRLQKRRVIKRAIKVIERDDGHEHQQAAHRRVDEKLDRRVDATLAAPDSDQEEHRDQRCFKEQVEEQQVERNKDADHRRFKNEQKGVIRELSLLDRGPARQHCDRHQERRQKNEPQADAIDAQVIARINQPDPAYVLFKPELGATRARAVQQQ